MYEALSYETVGGHFFYALRKEVIQSTPLQSALLADCIPIPGYICEDSFDVCAVQERPKRLVARIPQQAMRVPHLQLDAARGCGSS